MSKRFAIIVLDTATMDQNEQARVVSVTASEMQHICDCITAGNDDPPEDVPEESRDTAFQFAAHLCAVILDA